MKKVLFALILFVVSSCNSPEINISENIVKQLSDGDFKIPSVHGFALLFVSSKNNVKGCTNVNVLHEVFLKYYTEKYSDFRSFLSDALNQKVKFSQESLDKWGVVSFKLSENIEKKYSQLLEPDFVREYFDISDDGHGFVVKAKYSNDSSLYSILYYCFINDYKITLDDFHGKYFIKKSVDLKY